MRYYEIRLPDATEAEQPYIVTNARRLRNLPEGTVCHAIVTDRDGSLVETWEVPVENGRVRFSRGGKGIRNPKMHYG